MRRRTGWRADSGQRPATLNQGRLIFAGGSLSDYTGGNLIWIIHNAKEGGYR